VLNPGERIPTRRALAESFGTTLVTVQHALAILEEDDFVVSRGKLGTALIIPGGEGFQLYWDHLAEAAHRVVEEQGCRLSIYTDIDKRAGEDYERLLDDVAHDRLAGMIFATVPFYHVGTELLEKPGIPRIVAGSAPESHPHLAEIRFDEESFAAKAAELLAERQVQSAAVLCNPNGVAPRLIEELKRRGINCPDHFQHAVSLEHPKWARNIMRLLFDQGGANRPEALVMTDDNLFEYALTGIREAGLSIPEDVLLVSHSNFPWAVTCSVPVTRLGYDMTALLDRAMAELEHQREGHPPQNIKLEAVFEDELPGRNGGKPR
jgi:DNA-binding LacI/PurR family transcriptional regulator